MAQPPMASIRALFHGISQASSGSECRGLARGDEDFPPGLGIAPFPRGTCSHGERAESDQCDAFATAERLLHAVHEDIDSFFRLCFGDISTLGNSGHQIRFVHAPPLLL